MNKQFMAKMLQAKQIEYQALKEVLPESIVGRITKLENELVDIAKEYFMTMMQAEQNEPQASKKPSDTKVHKVTIE